MFEWTPTARKLGAIFGFLLVSGLLAIGQSAIGAWAARRDSKFALLPALIVPALLVSFWLQHDSGPLATATIAALTMPLIVAVWRSWAVYQRRPATSFSVLMAHGVGAYFLALLIALVVGVAGIIFVGEHL